MYLVTYLHTLIKRRLSSKIVKVFIKQKAFWHYFYFTMRPKPIQICIRIFIITLSIFRNIIGILFYKVKSHDSRVKFDFKKTLAEWCLISFSFLLHHVGICIWSCYTKGDTPSWNLEKLGDSKNSTFFAALLLLT